MANQVGRPRKKPLSAEIYTRETAWDATALIGVLPDPDRVLQKLGLDAETAFLDIETDDHITAVRAKRVGKLLSLEWDIVQGDASQNVADEMKKIFLDLDMRQFFKDVVLCRAWGRSPIEVIWSTLGRYWVPGELKQKPSRWFDYNDENELRFMHQASLYGEPVKPYKILIPRNEPDYDNPYGVKFLSRCYWPVTFKRNAYKWWNVLLEKFAMPYMFAKVPPNTSNTEKSKIINTLANLVQDSVGTMPNDSTLEMLEPKSGTGNADTFDKFRYSMDMATSKIWLGGTLTTEMGDVGSYSAAQTHESGEDSLVEDDKMLVINTAKQLIDWIMHFNFSGPAPEFKIEAPFEVSKEEMEKDKLAVEQGVRFSKKYYANKYQWDENEFEVTEPQQKEAPDKEGEDEEEEEKDEGLSQIFLDTVSKYKDQAAIDMALESITDEELQEQAEGMLNPIISMIEKASDYKEVKSKLLSQWPKMDSEAVEDMILQAVFVSEAIGRISGEDK